jgi:hypothetical protein
MTVTIQQGAIGKGPAAFGTNPLIVPLDTTVTWVNQDTVAHTVTATDGSFNSGPIAPGQSFSHMFDSAGSWTYFCSIHGQASMSGSVVVTNSCTLPSGGPSPLASALPSGIPSPGASGAAGTASPMPSGMPSGTGY